MIRVQACPESHWSIYGPESTNAKPPTGWKGPEATASAERQRIVDSAGKMRRLRFLLHPISLAGNVRFRRDL